MHSRREKLHGEMNLLEAEKIIFRFFFVTGYFRICFFIYFLYPSLLSYDDGLESVLSTDATLLCRWLVFEFRWACEKLLEKTSGARGDWIPYLRMRLHIFFFIDLLKTRTWSLQFVLLRRILTILFILS